jgi:hypothetical protein
MDWNNRSDRIHRLKEKENFRTVVMPLAYAGGGIALLALFWEGVTMMDGGKCTDAVWIPAVFFLVLPILLSVYRWLRGHYNKRLFA